MKQVARVSLFLLIAVTLQCAVGAPSHALTTYYYTGSPFTGAWGAADAGSYITASIAVRPGLGSTIVQGYIESWRFTYNDLRAGFTIPLTLSSSAGQPIWGLSMAVFLNAGGIVDWNLSVSGVPVG